MDKIKPWLVMALAIWMAGCGYNPEKGVYDTSANPAGFPRAALDLLNGIDSGKLAGMDDIVSSFGQLYTDHPELLDDSAWSKVIYKLGSKFRYIADEHAKEGIRGYTRAAEFYQLASFARPDEARIQNEAALYANWLVAVRTDDSDMAAIVNDEILSVPKVLAVTRYFVLADSLRREFFRLHLRQPLRDKIEKQHLLSDGALAEMAAADRELVIMAGLIDTKVTDQVARFVEPAIDLAAYRVTDLDSLMVFEMYFVPRESVTTKIDVISSMMNPAAGHPAQLDVQIAARKTGRRGMTIGGWQRDKITAVVDTVSSGLPGSKPMVGLARKDTGGWTWMSVEKRGGNMLPLNFEPQPADSVATQ